MNTQPRRAAFPNPAQPGDCPQVLRPLPSSIQNSQCKIENLCCGLSADQFAGKLARCRRLAARRQHRHHTGRILQAIRSGLVAFEVSL